MVRGWGRKGNGVLRSRARDWATRVKDQEVDPQRHHPSRITFLRRWNRKLTRDRTAARISSFDSPAKNDLNIQLTDKDQGDGAAVSDRVNIAILMCTYNGASFLREQLDSFSNQSHTDWTVYVSDDGSTDETRSILADYQQRWGAERLMIFAGPCQGFGKNFISLVKRSEIQARYYAFSDQDDIWFSDKLERGVAKLGAYEKALPSLYCSRTRLIDAERNVIGFSPRFCKTPSLKNALVQSLAGANTMIMNQTARDILLQLPDDADVVAHDWLTYILITGCGGNVFYDAEATLDYRQHDNNIIGANTNLRSHAMRLVRMLSGHFVEWNDSNLRVLSSMRPLLTQESRIILDHFEKSRHLTGPLNRLSKLRQSGVYRQTLRGNISLILAACMGKI